jgi:site-specific recombinase XerD
MQQIELFIEKFLNYCTVHRKLSALSVRNYLLDMRHFARFLTEKMPDVATCPQITRAVLNAYLDELSGRYKVKTIKRKSPASAPFFNFFGIPRDRIK